MNIQEHYHCQVVSLHAVSSHVSMTYNMFTFVLGHNRKPTLPVTISEDAGTVPCGIKGASVGDSNFESTSGMRKPIVTTQFVQWASSHFAGCSLENQTDLVKFSLFSSHFYLIYCIIIFCP